MDCRLTNFIADEPLMRVLRALLRSPAPRHLRELCSVCGLSPGGVSDIVRRLDRIGVLKRSSRGNRKYFSLVLNVRERVLFEQLFSLYEEGRLRERAKRFGERAREKLDWMDEAYAFIQSAKGRTT